MKNSALFIVIAVAVAAVVTVIIVYVLKYLKGRITLTLDRGACNGGESLTGRVDVVLKQPVECNRLVVSLVGIEETRQQRNNKTEVRSREIYRTETDLAGAQTLPAGFQQSYVFSVPTPDTSAGGMLNPALLNTLKFGMEVLTGQSQRIKWRVETRLDAKGVDLTASRPVTLNLV